jgi:hypothetical protein
MLLGLSLGTFTVLHVLISLVGILAGLVVLVALGRGRHLPAWAFVFLLATVLTSVTGFLFPLKGVTPAVIFGLVSLAVLLPVLYGLYGAGFAGGWRLVYVWGSIFTLYLNCVVLIVQSFQKVPLLNALAPQGNEPPVLVAQALLLALFVWLAVRAVRRFHPLRTPPL